MAIKFIPDGKDFGPEHFSKDFGFTESAKGRHDPRAHPSRGEDEYGDGTLVSKMRAGGKAKPKVKKMAVGGQAAPGADVAMPTSGGLSAAMPGGDSMAPPMSHATITMPVQEAAKTAATLANAGRLQGARAAARGMIAGKMGLPVRPRVAPAVAPAVTAAAPTGALGAGNPGAMTTTPMAKGGHLTAKQRNAMPESEFALPGGRYPINDASHARNALARVSGNGTSGEKAKVRAAVHRKYPNIGKDK